MRIMRLEVQRAPGYSDQWCVTADGTYVVGFAGPDARYRALQQRDELEVLLRTVIDARSAGPGDADEPFPPSA